MANGSNVLDAGSACCLVSEQKVVYTHSLVKALLGAAQTPMLKYVGTSCYSKVEHGGL